MGRKISTSVTIISNIMARQQFSDMHSSTMAISCFHSITQSLVSHSLYMYFKQEIQRWVNNYITIMILSNLVNFHIQKAPVRQGLKYYLWC